MEGWFIITLPRSSSKVKDVGQRPLSQNEDIFSARVHIRRDEPTVAESRHEFAAVKAKLHYAIQVADMVADLVANL